MMNRTTGAAIDPALHLRQSVADILATPIGSRVMRRTYGSLVPALLDQPHNRALAGRVAAAAASAITRWEPRLIVRRVQLVRHPDHAARGVLHIEATVRALAAPARPLQMEVAL